MSRKADNGYFPDKIYTYLKMFRRPRNIFEINFSNMVLAEEQIKKLRDPNLSAK